MKKILFFAILLIGISIASLKVVAQSTPPPPPQGHGENNNQPPGGGAPIKSGLGILLFMCAAYGGYKIYRAAKPLMEIPPFTYDLDE
jgi:hypothetical protein